MEQLLGVDFGTTNSVVAILQPDGSIATRMHAFGQKQLDTFRTVLCFWAEEARGRSLLHHAAGPAAVQAYLDDPLDSRLIMSMKTYLAQRSFVQTSIFGRMHGLEQMVALFLDGLLGGLPGESHEGARVVAGRPVRFAGEFTDDEFGETRLRASFARAGYQDIGVALEPEAAGFRFARGLDMAATVLVGDFGGGTSDFSVMRFEPDDATMPKVRALSHAGIGIAGDSFDARIIDQVIAPLLGKGDSYCIMGNPLPVPPEYFSGFARWHRLSLMRTPRMLREIAEVAAASEHPGRLRTLISLIEDEMGYPLYQAVSAVKAELSHAGSAVLRFAHCGFAVERRIERHEFERWIAPDLARLSQTVGQALDQAGLRADEIDRVFLTGGTSFVPAVRALFEQRFGVERVSGGGEFVAVAEGLALIGEDRLGADRLRSA
nr:Hsp70 family protein [uncultured Lichenicoccus sp.]